MPDMQLDDVTIHYEEVGSGSLAYVFSPGLGGDGQSFVEHFPFWQRHFPRVLSWDNRGAGRSSQANRYNLPLCAGDLARLLDGLGVEKAVVHGVSWGGVVAQQFALDHLEKCAAIILDSTSSEVNVAASENWYNRGEVARRGVEAQIGEFRPAFQGHASSAQATQEQGVQVRPEHVDSYVANARAIAGLREHPLHPQAQAHHVPGVGGGGRPGHYGRGRRVGDTGSKPAQRQAGDIPGRRARGLPSQAGRVQGAGAGLLPEPQYHIAAKPHAARVHYDLLQMALRVLGHS